jgi:hypothetical protein
LHQCYHSQLDPDIVGEKNWLLGHATAGNEVTFLEQILDAHTFELKTQPGGMTTQEKTSPKEGG